MGTYMHAPGLKSAGIPSDLITGQLVDDIPEDIATLQTQKTYHPNRRITDTEQDQMLREAAATGSVASVEAKYGVSKGYLRDALTRRFGSLEKMKEVLLGLVAENAIVVQMIAQEKAGELTAPQAIFAGKLLVDTMEKIEKSIQSTPKTIDFRQLNRMGETIATLRAVVDGTTGKSA